MSTLTLEVPDDLTEVLAEPESRAEAFALLRAHFGTSTGDTIKLSPEGVAAIQKSLAAAEAGAERRFDPEMAHREGLEILASLGHKPAAGTKATAA